MGKTIDTYKEARTFHFENMTVRVHIPDLTTEERNRRMKAVYKSASELLKSKSKKRSKKNEKENSKENGTVTMALG